MAERCEPQVVWLQSSKGHHPILPMIIEWSPLDCPYPNDCFPILWGRGHGQSCCHSGFSIPCSPGCFPSHQQNPHGAEIRGPSGPTWAGLLQYRNHPLVVEPIVSLRKRQVAMETMGTLQLYHQLASRKPFHGSIWGSAVRKPRGLWAHWASAWPGHQVSFRCSAAAAGSGSPHPGRPRAHRSAVSSPPVGRCVGG